MARMWFSNPARKASELMPGMDSATTEYSMPSGHLMARQCDCWTGAGGGLGTGRWLAGKKNRGRPRARGYPFTVRYIETSESWGIDRLIIDSEVRNAPRGAGFL